MLPAAPKGPNTLPNSSFLAISNNSSATVLDVPAVTEEPKSEFWHIAPTYHESKLLPITPAALSHELYTRTQYLPHGFQDRELTPLNAQVTSTRWGPEGWTRRVSPEGRPYYWHPALKVYTNVDLCSRPSCATELEEIACVLRARALGQPSSSALELVITTNSPQRDSWGYYFADSVHKTISWVDPILLSTVLEGYPRFVSSDSHLGLELEAQYWYAITISGEPLFNRSKTHIETFPDGREVTTAQVECLRDLLTFAYTDTATCSSSITPFDTEALDKINTMLNTVRVGPNNREGTWSIARYMSTFKHEMFLHYYGEYGARLNRTESVHEMPIHRERSYAFLCISSLFFYVPDVFVRRFEEVSVDGLTNIGPWNEFRQQMRKGWDATTTPITVLLSANVALLAIGSIDGSSNPHPSTHRNIAQVACYASTILSLACYIICWILSRRHREDSTATAQEATQFIMRCRQSLFGVEGAALVYSLPEALFTWSMLLFLAAVVYLCMAGSDIITRSVTGILLGLMAVMVVAVLFADWGTIAPSSKTLWQRNRDLINEARRFTAHTFKRMLGLHSKTREEPAEVGEQPIAFPVPQVNTAYGTGHNIC